MLWPLEMARPVLRAFRRITADAPDELTLWAQLFRFPPVPELPDVTVYVERLRALFAGKQLLGARRGNPFLVRTVEPKLEDAVGLPNREYSFCGRAVPTISACSATVSTV